MRIRYTVAVLVLAAIAGCIARGTSQVAGPAEGASPAPVLGLITDEKLQVVDLLPLGTAAQAGVQVGDILVSIAPAPPLPPGQEEPTYPLSPDVVPIIVDEQGQPIALTPAPGESMAAPGTPLDPAIIAATATAEVQLTAIAATPAVVYPEATATAAAMAATAAAMQATETVRLEEERYQECLATLADNPDAPEWWCVPPGGGVLTETVMFTETARVKAIISHHDPLNRMILTVLRDGKEIKFELVAGPHNPARPDQPERDANATPTPIPPSYYFF